MGHRNQRREAPGRASAAVRVPRGLPNLPGLKAFEAAARTGSFAAAAAELNLTSGAVSYQIRALETQLGCVLFERRARGVRLSPMGVAYLPPVRKAFEDLADSTLGLFGGGARTCVRLHAPVSLGAAWLAPRLPRFQASHVDVDLRLSCGIWDRPAPDPATDLEIRYGAGHWHGYRSEFLFNQPLLAVVSPALRTLAPTRAAARALLAARLVPIMGYERHWMAARAALDLPEAPAADRLAVDTTLAALELAAAGAGCVLTHRVFLGAHLATGRLVPLLEEEIVDEHSHFVVAPERPHRTRREVNACRDWLLSLAREN